VISADVAGPEVENALVGVDVFVFVFVVELEVSGPGAAFDALVSVADVAERQASADTAFAFDVLVPVRIFSVEVDSSQRPRFFSLPNIAYYASPSSSCEVVGEESSHDSTGVRTNYGSCSILSTPGPHQNKNLEHYYNKPSPGHNSASDTNALPMDATRNHSRKKCLLLCQEQRTHSAYQAILSPPEVPKIQRVVAEVFQFQYSHLLLPLLRQERQLPTPKGLSPKAVFSFLLPSFYAIQYISSVKGALLRKLLRGRLAPSIPQKQKC
jgi:hypothetical protein